MTDSPTTQWLTVRQSAETYGLSQKTIRRRIADGTLLARRVGPRLIRINIASLEQLGRPLQYIESGTL